MEGTEVADRILSRIEQDRTNYAKFTEMLTEVQADKAKLLPFLPSYFRTTPEDQLRQHVANQSQLFNSYAGLYCVKACGNADNESCMSECTNFWNSALEIGFKRIKDVHKEYFYTKLGDDDE